MGPNIRQLQFSASIAMLSAQSPGTFTAAGNLITAEGSPQATLLSNGKVLITGNSAELYDPVSGSFSPTGTIDSRAFNSCTLLGRFNDAQLYDPPTGVFVPTGAMAKARSAHTATVLPDGSVLVAGGESQTCYSNGTSEGC
jgi:hypothetical protein